VPAQPQPHVAQPHVTRPRVEGVIHVGAHGDIEAVLIAPDEIEAKIGELAAAIDKDYVGASCCWSACSRARDVHVRLARALGEFVAVGVHGGELLRNATTSSGVVRILKDLDHDIAVRTS